MMKWMILSALCLSQTAVAEPARPDFHRLVYALHEQQLAAHTVRTDEETGSYNGLAAAGYRYHETRYYDFKTGRLLSRIRRDADVPDAIHISEVNIYGANGQLTRDYVSIAPPATLRLHR